MHALTTCRLLPVAVLTISLFALALSGCGSSVDPALVESAGKHGNALEAVYAAVTKQLMKNASTRDLKDVNRALRAKDPKQATAGDLRRAQGEIQHRINVLASYKRTLAAANRKLHSTPPPDFADDLDKSKESEDFAAAYTKTTRAVERSGAAASVATRYALTALERYLDFFEQWEEYVTRDDTAGFLSSAEASDSAVATMKKKIAVVDRNGGLSRRIDPYVGEMADAASNDGQIAQLITDLRDQYPKSFLPVHIVEQK
jgi:hypothetical protein